MSYRRSTLKIEFFPFGVWAKTCKKGAFDVQKVSAPDSPTFFKARGWAPRSVGLIDIPEINYKSKVELGEVNPIHVYYHLSSGNAFFEFEGRWWKFKLEERKCSKCGKNADPLFLGDGWECSKCYRGEKK